MQIVDAMVDQRLHGVRGTGASSTSDIVQQVMEEHSVFPFVPGTCPQARSASCDCHCLSLSLPWSVGTACLCAAVLIRIFSAGCVQSQVLSPGRLWCDILFVCLCTSSVINGLAPAHIQWRDHAHNRCDPSNLTTAATSFTCTYKSPRVVAEFFNLVPV
jgi:hypothetical protein